MSSYYTNEELSQMGFISFGENVLISRKSSIYGASRMRLGHHVRIDDFCFLSAGSGGIEIGNYVHIAAYAALTAGEAAIRLGDYSGVSSRVSIYSSNDDYSGERMSNPTIPADFKGVTHAEVVLEKHAIVGSGCVILPGVTLHQGAAVGALSFVNKSCEAFYIYKGNPAKKLAKRSRNLLEVEKEFLKTLGNNPH